MEMIELSLRSNYKAMYFNHHSIYYEWIYKLFSLLKLIIVGFVVHTMLTIMKPIDHRIKGFFNAVILFGLKPSVFIFPLLQLIFPL